MRKKYKAFLLLLIVFLGALLSGCSKTYSMTSSDVYAYGEKLQGPSSGVPKAKVALNNSKPRDGTAVEFEYAGRTYNGTVKSGFVLWNRDPLIVGDSTDMYTLISENNGEIHLTHNCKVGEIWVEVRQSFEAEKSSGVGFPIIAALAVIAVAVLLVCISRQKKVHPLQKQPNSADEILRYKDLYDQGIISEEEFTEKRSNF